MLEIAARYSGSPISNLEIKLFMGGTTDFVKSKTGPAGKAQFNITQSRKYYLQSAQDSIYLFAELPSFQLTLCQSTEPSQPNASQQPSANATQSASAPCASYSYESCPSSCVVCPPCAVCSSISCQTEEFCAGMGFSRGWYGSIKPVVGAIKNQTSSQQGAAQQQTGSQSQSTGAQGNLPSQSQQGAQQQSGAAASGTGAQPALALAASGTILVVIIIATLGIAYFVFFRKRKGL
jgi:hypothetical protein